MEAHLFLGRAYHNQGNDRQAVDCFTQAVAALEGVQRRERFGLVFLPAVHARAWLAWCHAELGTFAEGRALGDEGLRIAEAVAHPASLMNAYLGIGWLAFRQGDLPRALPLLERAMGICQDAGLLALSTFMAMPLGTAYTLGGRVADALSLLTAAVRARLQRCFRGAYPRHAGNGWYANKGEPTGVSAAWRVGQADKVRKT